MHNLQLGGGVFVPKWGHSIPIRVAKQASNASEGGNIPPLITPIGHCSSFESLFLTLPGDVDSYTNVEPFMDQLFKALNDPTRRRMLELLRLKDMNATEIADCFQISKPTISHHLDLLKQADLIVSEKNGQFVIYSLNTSVLDECLSWLMTIAKPTKKGKQHETEQPKKRMGANIDLGHAVLRRRSTLG
jgi:DNA-binding transcriptional ArsR family regulator